MVDSIKEWLVKTIRSRLFIVWIVMIVFCIIAVRQLFLLQVIGGEDYLNNYTLSIEKEIPLTGSRGNIYDRNGVLLAHNELSHTITLEDNGNYEPSGEKSSAEVKNERLNAEINTLIDMIEANGDSIVNDLDLYMDESGNLSFLAEGTSLQGFRRDVYGRKSIDDLRDNPRLGYDEANATPEQIYDYLTGEFGIDTDVYGRVRSYQIMAVRYALSLNSYQKYISTDIARDVSDEAVAMVEEHLYELQGVEVNEDTVRVYDHPEYFSHIIGYTGTISSDEYETLRVGDDSYTLSDTVGKAGIEQVMESELQGEKGTQTVYVDNVGNVLEEAETEEPTAGNDIYLSIDADLQMAVYDLLERELAGILYSEIINAKTDESGEMRIPVYDVYNALIENNVIDVTRMSEADPGTTQFAVFQAFLDYRRDVYETVEAALEGDTPFGDLSDETQEYLTSAIAYLQESGVFDTSGVNSSDEVYANWKKGDISAREYLTHAIESSWIQTASFDPEKQCADMDATYEALASYMMGEIQSSLSFDKIVYRYLIFNDEVSGEQLCQILFEQGVLAYDEDMVENLADGDISACEFIKEKIGNLEITPAQLALDPCTASCVIMSPDTGELLACVSYPGYDTNRLANSMDAAYYNQLLSDESLPLYNNATQQTTAPGSTFKMVTASAGLTEGVITPESEIQDTGVFDRLDYNLRCWVYPSNHGWETVVTALRDSCNTFFCEVGYRLSLVGGVYDEDVGLSRIRQYADEFGLGEKTGLEIPEGNSKVADEYPVSASIGQSDNKFTTVQLCRYVAAIANEGSVYDLTLLDRETDAAGNERNIWTPALKNQIADFSPSTWSVLREGMREVIGQHTQFDDLGVSLAGKTGTAQESDERPNHALFVGYAPADDPEVAIATRIAYGYSSNNACDLADAILKYYFGEETKDELLNGQAAEVEDSSNSFAD